MKKSDSESFSLSEVSPTALVCWPLAVSSLSATSIRGGKSTPWSDVELDSCHAWGPKVTVSDLFAVFGTVITLDLGEKQRSGNSSAHFDEVVRGDDWAAKNFGVEHFGSGTLDPICGAAFQFVGAASKVIGLDTSNGLLGDQMTEVEGLGDFDDTVGDSDGLSCLVNLSDS